ncbi:MAG: hypothetical protein MZW92_50210 [Comamonadaceae bacterium]|nr:hypothetical protein [Comamonadaceae bacterium]
MMNLRSRLTGICHRRPGHVRDARDSSARCGGFPPIAADGGHRHLAGASSACGRPLCLQQRDRHLRPALGAPRRAAHHPARCGGCGSPTSAAPTRAASPACYDGRAPLTAPSSSLAKAPVPGAGEDAADPGPGRRRRRRAAAHG